ncbi:MAG: hypothetical protein JWO30_4836 [Fibrobacteres bacterium]|nr:hypothetical protein [Fibrobacterota bacterium]
MDIRFRKSRVASALALGLVLIACEGVPKLSADPALLASSEASTLPPSPDCASCHTYPLHDVNHNYHLMSANVNRNNLGQPELNNVTTCLDCHYNSIKHYRFVHSDTVWADSSGQELFQHTSPSDVALRIANYPGYRPIPVTGAADTSRGRFLAADIDSMIFRFARAGKMVQWRTAYAHDNGKVDVAFAPNDVTSPESLATAYKPRDLSCSAVTCHNTRSATYRWMSPRLGLGNCPSLDGNDPTCGGEVQPSSAKKSLP